MRVALVGASAALDALRGLLGDECVLAVARTTADHVAQAVEKDGAAVLDLPAGEAREFARALAALGLRVLDLGPDLRVPQVACAFLGGASGKRLASMPSAPALAAFVACAPLLARDVMHAGRLVIEAPGQAASELSWMLDQAGFPRMRLMQVSLHPEGVLALVVGDIGNDAHEAATVKDAYAALEDVRLCEPAVQPGGARVAGTALAEVSVQVDEFAEFVVAACALDPVAFVANAALRALRQMAG
jgi:hypothetical protein